MSARAEAPPSDSQRAWWLRVPLVLQSPRAVFAALRDQSEGAVEARQEPVTALVFLGGVAAVLLGFSTIMDDHAVDGLLVVVIAVVAGGIYGFFAYWLLGWALSTGVKALRGSTSAHLCRHVLAFSAAPLVLSLVALWPLRLAMYGSDLFKSGGPDAGTAGQVLRWVTVAFAAWTVALLVLGIRTVQGWTWLRALVASLFAVALTGAVLVLWVALGTGFG